MIITIQGRLYQEHSLNCPDCHSVMLLRPSPYSSGVMYVCLRNGCGATHSANPDGSPVGVPGNASTRSKRKSVHQTLAQLKLSTSAVKHWAQGVLNKTNVVVSALTEAECDIILNAAKEDFGIVTLDSRFQNNGYTEISMGG